MSVAPLVRVEQESVRLYITHYPAVQATGLSGLRRMR